MVYLRLMKKTSLFSVLVPYKGWIAALVVFSLGLNALNLLIPKIIASSIDAYSGGTFVLDAVLIKFISAMVFIFLFIYAQSIFQVLVSERVARNLRRQITEKISRQTFQFVQGKTTSKLLTNLTSDVDGVKVFVSQTISTMTSSLFLVIGASILLLVINWKLGLVVLSIIPIIGITFGVVFSKVGGLFKKTQEVIDQLNRVINESVLGAAIIRVLNSHTIESGKFLEVNLRAKSLGMSILKLFASMVPVIALVSNLALITILVLGGHFVINGSMTIGDITAFNSYIGILIFPLMMLGFMGNVIARAKASMDRIAEILDAPDILASGNQAVTLSGLITIENISVSFGDKQTLHNVSITIRPKTRTAIIGPTAAGKTSLLYAMTGLVNISEGKILYDTVPLSEIDRGLFHKQTGLVFQDSVMFNLSIRDNILFGSSGTDDDLKRALITAELSDLIESLPEGIETIVSERGTSLSGGQKQRIMLARALAMNPTILFLDDFTARVDIATETRIITNLETYYPNLTLVSVTQKILTAASYDQVILMMEGEVLASGTHDELVHTSPEYVQILNSQKSTQTYELQS